MRISDWSSDVCSSDLNRFSSLADPYYATQWFITDQVGEWNWERFSNDRYDELHQQAVRETDLEKRSAMYREMQDLMEESGAYRFITHEVNAIMYRDFVKPAVRPDGIALRSEEHTAELQSLMRIS